MAAATFFDPEGCGCCLFLVPIPGQRAMKCHTRVRPFCDILGFEAPPHTGDRLTMGTGPVVRF